MRKYSESDTARARAMLLDAVGRVAALTAAP